MLLLIKLLKNIISEINSKCHERILQQMHTFFEGILQEIYSEVMATYISSPVYAGCAERILRKKKSASPSKCKYVMDCSGFHAAW